MLVHTVCPTCAKESTVPDLYVGKKVKCAGCGESFSVRVVEVESLPLAPVADIDPAPPAPTESTFAQLDERVNWQGHPFFHCHYQSDRADVPEYRCFFTPDRLVFLPYEPRPATTARDPSGAALAGLALGLTVGTGVGVLGAGIGYVAAKTSQTAAADKFRNQDERFREWKVEDLAAVDPKAFVILPRRTEQVLFRSNRSGWVVVVFRRDNGHEWVVRPVADPDLKVCLENLTKFGFRVTNTVEWDPRQERYVVIEEDIEMA